MDNLSAVFHDRFSKLHEVTSNYNKATLLDKIIYWWQISKYTLDDDHIWFTRSIDQIANDAKISKRSVERYLSEFEKNGLIYKINRLFMKKHLYIRITDKLLAIICETPTPNKSSYPKNENTTQPMNLSNIVQTNVFIDSSTEQDTCMPEQKNKNLKDVSSIQKDSLILNQNGVINSATLACSIYKDKDSNINNNSTVMQSSSVNNFKTPLTKNKKTTYMIEDAIGERLSPRLKNYIKGTLSNLQIQHNLQFSNPEQLFAEVVFSVINKNDQLTGIEKDHHRVNIIAKLLREKKWLTPKGFYNHWDVGSHFKQAQAENDKAYQHQKQQDIDSVGTPFHTLSSNDTAATSSAIYFQKKPAYADQQRGVEQQNQWREIMMNITTEERYLNEMEKQQLRTPSQMNQSVIKTIINKLDKLNKIKHQLEKNMIIKKVA